MNNRQFSQASSACLFLRLDVLQKSDWMPALDVTASDTHRPRSVANRIRNQALLEHSDEQALIFNPVSSRLLIFIVVVAMEKGSLYGMNRAPFSNECHSKYDRR